MSASAGVLSRKNSAVRPQLLPKRETGQSEADGSSTRSFAGGRRRLVDRLDLQRQPVHSDHTNA